MNALVLNPGSNSLKAGIVSCSPDQRSASEEKKLVELIVEGIGKQAKLSVYDGKKIAHSEPIQAASFEEACAKTLDWARAYRRDRAIARSSGSSRARSRSPFPP